jgi:hypothetical protein
MRVASRQTAKKNAYAIHFTTDAVCVNLVVIVFATRCMKLGKTVSLTKKEKSVE